ncbi:HD-GYP domain-containing protein [Bacillus kwashiorkori]|uniref:HD-GYP domain-containing protein n=1 Tax=Bacillus kwashiorkori TaxID=1522318 RepID=UPI000781CAEC|nr:HD domain-containing phosphohydrolase [Bacillus kwashiorkori]
MHFKEHGVILKKAGEAIEKVSYRGMDIELLASYDGTEIIKHYLHKGARWSVGPTPNWDALEFIYILSGELHLLIDENQYQLNSGDYVKMLPIKSTCIFQADENTEFIYATSKPVFHSYSQTIEQLKDLGIAVEEKDGYTADHCSRIMRISMLIGERLKLRATELLYLNLGAFLHDIGKIHIPDSILQKPEKLTKEEWDEIKKHPIYGHDILTQTNLPSLIQAAKIVEQHHERYDGKGYPYGLKENEITIGASIVSVADSYDAMTTDRVYRKALTEEEALAQLIEGSGSMYNPEVVQAFLSIYENFKKRGEKL